MEMEARMKSMGRVPMKCDGVMERNVSTRPTTEAVSVRRNNMQDDPMAMFVLKIGLLASPLGVWHFGIMFDNGPWMVEN